MNAKQRQLVAETRMATLRARLAATEALRALRAAPAARPWREWDRVATPVYPAPTDEPQKAHRCKTCRDLELRPSWRCLACGRQLCQHGLKVVRLDGTGYCRPCAWARTRAFNERFGLTSRQEREPAEGEAPSDGDE